MRTIDADRLLEERRIHTYYHLPNGDIAIPIIDIEHAPTIEPQRKTGRWIPLQLSMANPPYQCSCCFQNAPMIETGCLMNRHLEALLTDFCPNCGADMRGEGEK